MFASPAFSGGIKPQAPYVMQTAVRDKNRSDSLSKNGRRV
jgi:hypothetical protein